MASLRVHPDRLEIQLSAAEKALALRRDEISVPRAAIRSVTITDDPWIWIRGIRAPGALIPLVLAIGTWKFHGGKDFLIIKNKRQAVIIDIADEEYARIIVSTNHAVDLVDTLNVGGEAAEAADAEAKPRAAGGTKAGVKPTAKPAAKPRRKPVVTPKLADAVAPAAEPIAAEAIAAGSKTAAPTVKKPRKAQTPPAADPA
ncbi:hypothetical protein [Leifsonia sp. Root4]|uniref:hypothetical protein n=1 Tax=Leifsonia sp. Root4 TaxID=1736525 RepID=UPI000A403179|nr:hypothetical protein [Leifsonia sp. Root4]